MHDNSAPHANILDVDDTPANLRLLAGMLTEHHYKVRPVPNGSLALGAVKAAPPDLILLDINMPGMNGYEVCQALKADQATRDIHVIFISALDEVMDKVKAFEVGGADYITKPFQFAEVMAASKLIYPCAGCARNWRKLTSTWKIASRNAQQNYYNCMPPPTGLCLRNF
jgi:two-component system, NtrC family, sensor kinase